VGVRTGNGRLTAVAGAIIILVAMFVVGPIGLFLAGAVWSAIHGWLETDAADTRAS
jgi:hypothetical protein